MSRSLLHIGLQKTGTTSLQMSFLPALAALNDCDYLGKNYQKDASYTEKIEKEFTYTHLPINHNGQQLLISSLIEAENKIYWEAIAGRYRAPKPAIISSERILITNKFDNWRSTMSLYKEIYNPIVLVSIRDVGSWVKSFYTHMAFIDFTRRRRHFPLEEFAQFESFALCMAFLADGERLRWLVKTFRDVVFFDAFRVLVDGLTRQRFCRRIGYLYEELPDFKERKNAGFTRDQSAVGDEAMEGFQNFLKAQYGRIDADPKLNKLAMVWAERFGAEGFTTGAELGL
jgi:hypothetical protein